MFVEEPVKVLNEIEEFLGIPRIILIFLEEKVFLVLNWMKSPGASACPREKPEIIQS